MSDISEPTCSKCRWHKVATAAGRYIDQRVVLGIMVAANGWPGIDIGDNHHHSLGGVYCEHEHQPRGLVLTNYACRNFERPPEVSMVDALSYSRKAIA